MGPAQVTASEIVSKLDIYGLHFAFLDPFSLGVLEFDIFKTLAKRKRMDILVHLNKMDLQRNLGRNIKADASALDAFAPGWRAVVDVAQGQRAIRGELVDHWRSLVEQAGFDPSAEMKLIKGGQEQHLYWLLLVAAHEQAHKFWKIAANKEKQGSFEF